MESTKKGTAMTAQLVYMTAGSRDEARQIAKTLITAKLAACINIIAPVNSLYMWNGQIQDDAEVVMIAKSTAERLPELIDTVKRIHSYDCPCVVSLPIGDGNPDFLSWIAAGVK
jgi:periplasmic divalent cation tolerance protein